MPAEFGFFLPDILTCPRHWTKPDSRADLTLVISGPRKEGIMRRRLYFLLPNTESANQMLNDLLLARIEERRVHFLAKPDIALGDLPEANVLQKTDVIHGAEMGLAIGAISGVIGGALVLLFPPEGVHLQLGALLLAAIVGALFGTWVSSMVASAIPNSRLKSFAAAIERGQVLMMVDVPLYQVAVTRDLVEKRHPEAVSGGVEPTIPAFP